MHEHTRPVITVLECSAFLLIKETNFNFNCCCYRMQMPCVVSQSIEISALCRAVIPPIILVFGHESTMWDIVWGSPHSQRSLLARPHSSISRLGGWQVRSLCRPHLGAVRPLQRACQCWHCTADMVVVYLRAGSHGRGQERTVPVMILMDAFSCMSTSLVWGDLSHTGAQYLATE